MSHVRIILGFSIQHYLELAQSNPSLEQDSLEKKSNYKRTVLGSRSCLNTKTDNPKTFSQTQSTITSYKAIPNIPKSKEKRKVHSKKEI